MCVCVCVCVTDCVCVCPLFLFVILLALSAHLYIYIYAIICNVQTHTQAHMRVHECRQRLIGSQPPGSGAVLISRQPAPRDYLTQDWLGRILGSVSQAPPPPLSPLFLSSLSPSLSLSPPPVFIIASHTLRFILGQSLTMELID